MNSVMALPSELVTMNPSCFSAVMLVIGKNTWEKNFTPLARAQSFMAAATTSAVAGSSGAPVWTVFFMALKACFDRHSSMVARLKTSQAQISLSGPPASMVGGEVAVISSIALWRSVLVPMVAFRSVSRWVVRREPLEERRTSSGPNVVIGRCAVGSCRALFSVP